MHIVDDLTGDMVIGYGDNGEYTVTNIPTDKDYTALFIVYDSNRKTMFTIPKNTEMKDSVTFVFTPNDIEKLTVPKGEDTADYFFDIKLKFGINYIEDTLILGNKNMYAKNKLTVIAKGSEGEYING